MSAPAAPALIEVAALRVSFGTHVVLNDLALELRGAKVVGVRGANGAGKTTLVHVLLGLQRYSGTVRVLGHDPRERLSPAERPGALLSEDGLYEELPANAQLLLHARMFGVPDTAAKTRIAALCEELELTDVLERTPRTFSSGMRRRLALARCFLLEKPLYVLDEPDRGIDVEGRRWLVRKLRSLPEAGAGALVVSHDSALLDSACDEVHRLEAGRLQREQRSACWLRLFSDEPDLLREHLAKTSEVLWLSAYPDRIECGVNDREAALKLLGQLPTALTRRAEVRW